MEPTTLLAPSDLANPTDLALSLIDGELAGAPGVAASAPLAPPVALAVVLDAVGYALRRRSA